MSKSINSKQQRVLNAARKLLARNGFHGMSMKLLVQESGVAAGTIYLHFKDKQDILRQVHALVLSEIALAISEGYDPSLPLFDQYQALWRNLWNYFLTHRNTLMVKSQFDHLPNAAIKEDKEAAKSSFNAIVDFFETGRRSGILKDMPDEVLGDLSFEPCAALARRQLLGVVAIDENLLDRCILASWHAIACFPDSEKLKESAK